MLLNTWYVAGESKALGASPIRVKMLGQKFVLFRDETGKAACISDTCVHRGGALGNGKVKKGCIECPYHGWQYNSQGIAQYSPAHGPDFKLPARARVDAYPVQERYGWIWVFMGDQPESERPPLPDFPEVEETDKYRSVWGTFRWKANYARVVENALDPSHAAFVHGDTFGNPDDPTIPDFTVVKEKYSAHASLEMTRRPVRGLWSLLAPKNDEPVRVRNGFHMSGQAVLLNQWVTSKMYMALYDVNTPIDEYNTQTYWVAARNFMRGAWADKNAQDRVHRIFLQDQVIVENIEPRFTPSLSDELAVKSDAIQLTYRRKRQEWINRGWAIDLEKLEKLGKRKALKIPCPARRAEPDSRWTFETVPTVEPKGKHATRNGQASTASADRSEPAEA